MTEEVETGEALGEAQKTSRKDRWKGAIQRTKTKLKKPDGVAAPGDFKLSDDVNDFLQAGRPVTPDTQQGRSETPPDKLLYPQIDHQRMVQAGLTSATLPASTADITPPKSYAAPQRSPRGIPVPRIDVSTSQRWPRQQQLGVQDIDDFLRPAQQSRSQSHSAINRRKNRPRNLSVAFLEAPPTIIGEGGDEAQTPPSEISRARERARSVSPLSGRAFGAQAGQPARRKQAPPPANADPSQWDDMEPRRLQRAPTGFQFPGPAIRTAADIEFDMTLQPPTPVPSTSSTYLHARGLDRNESSVPPHVVAIVTPPPSTVADAPDPGGDGQHHLKPAMATHDLRMQYEEGEALRHSHYRGLSNTSIINESTAAQVQKDDLSFQQLSLDDTDEKHAVRQTTRGVDSDGEVEDRCRGWV